MDNRTNPSGDRFVAVRTGRHRLRRRLCASALALLVVGCGNHSKAEPEGPPTNYVNCFGEGTMITTPEGQVPIQDLEIGDRVISFDVTTGQLRSRRIIAIHSGVSSLIRELELAAMSGSDTSV